MIQTGTDQRGPGSVLTEQPDGAVVMESLGVAGRLRQLRRQRRQASTDKGNRERPVGLAQLANRGPDSDQVVAGRLLQLIDENQCRCQGRGRFAEDLEQCGQVVGVTAGVRHTGDWLHVDTDGDQSAAWVELEREPL